MELKKVSQAQIEELSADYDEALDKHRDLMATARAAAGLEGVYEDSAEQAELAALEAEILAEMGGDEEPEVEAKVEPTKVEPTKVETKVEPAKVEPAKVEPVKVEPEVAAAVAKESAAEESASERRRRSLDEELAKMEAELEAMDDVEDEDELLLE